MPSLFDIAKRQLTLTTHRIHTLPVLVLMPHSRCNCRCVMCDIWKANANGQELSQKHLAAHMTDIKRLGVQWVVLSGGEALMHSNLWALCEQLKSLPAKISLLSTGLLLKRHAEDILRWCDEVVVSLDGSPEIHDRIRNVPRAFDRLAEGIKTLKDRDPTFRVTARCVLQRQNYADLDGIIAAAHALNLDQISFLAADIATDAFNRDTPWTDERTLDVMLTHEEVRDFQSIMENVIAHREEDFASGFIAESPDKLRRLVQYYAALNGTASPPATVCNAPWVSTVVEPDGAVRPCFFHPALGNIHEQSLASILNSPEAIAFRRNLDVTSNPICRYCVCTLTMGPRAAVTTR